MCLAVSLLGAVALASWFQPGEGERSHRVWTLDGSSAGGGGRLLLRPFVTPGKAYGVALDGGGIPLFAFETPSLHFGTQVDCPLYLVMLADWQSAESRNLLRLIHESYEADTTASLPPLALTLLPAMASGSGKQVQDTIIAAHFVSNATETLPDLLRSISSGSTAAELAAIRDSLREAEPDIVPRIDTTLSTPQVFLEKVTSIARSQMRWNSSLLGCKESTQLVSMRQILTGNPDAGQLAAFLAEAKSRQNAYLSSPAGRVPVIPPSGCDCKDADHPHSSS